MEFVDINTTTSTAIDFILEVDTECSYAKNGGIPVYGSITTEYNEDIQAYYDTSNMSFGFQVTQDGLMQTYDDIEANVQVHTEVETISTTSQSITFVLGNIYNKESVLEYEEIKVVIPKRLFDSGTLISIEEITETEDILKKVEKDTVIKGNIYGITSSSKNIFDDYVEISLPVDDSVDLDKLAIYYYNEDLEKWIYVGGEVIDGVITVDINHFTKFAVFQVDNKLDFTQRYYIVMTLQKVVQ